MYSLTLNNKDEKSLNTFYNKLALFNEYKNILSDIIDLSDNNILIKSPAGGILIDVEIESTIARVRSDLKILTAIGKESLNALDIIGTVVRASFVILDFIDHN